MTAMIDADQDARPVAEYCSVADNYCQNPPGYSLGGRCGANSDGPRIKARCVCCGETACASCRTGKRGAWLCNNCQRDGYTIGANGLVSWGERPTASPGVAVGDVVPGDVVVHDGGEYVVMDVATSGGGVQVVAQPVGALVAIDVPADHVLARGARRDR